jgi:NIMA-interacting peptidyl-prolyl cis-trans isomerase 1
VALLILLKSETGLPEGWVIKISTSKNHPYYFNAATQDSRWEPPEGSDADKLKSYLAAHGPGSTAAAESNKVRAAHLLVKHRDSRRPASWRSPEITRSKEEALEILQGHEAQITSGSTTLQELAARESDCSSAKKGGDL